MLKRIRWFGAGVVVGALGAVYTLFRLRESRQRFTDPDKVIDTLGSAMKKVGGTVRDAWDDSRDTMAEVEADLREDYEAKRPRLRSVNG